VASTPRPFSAHEWQIAWRYLRARRQHGGISVIAWYALIGVMLGVATLIVVQAVMIGFREEFTDRILGANAHMTVYNQNYQDENGAITRAITDYAQVVETVRTVDGVTHVSPMVRGQVMGSANGRNVGVDLRGQAPEDIAKLPLIGTPEAAFGELSDLPNGIAIGEGVARELRIGVGDTMTIISPNGVQTAFGATMPRLNDYEVVYVFKVGRYDIDQTRVYLPLAEAQYYFDREGSVDEIEVLVENPDRIDDYRANILGAIDQNKLLWSWKDSQGAILSAGILHLRLCHWRNRHVARSHLGMPLRLLHPRHPTTYRRHLRRSGLGPASASPHGSPLTPTLARRISRHGHGIGPLRSSTSRASWMIPQRARSK